MTHILYAAPLSLYSGKARAFLDWKGVDYEEVLATPEIHKKETIPPIGRPVIPVIKKADGTVLQDTTVIIDHFEAADPAAPSVYPTGPRQKFAALLLECFGDEWLLLPAMHYRWNYNDPWIYGEFGKVALPGGTPEEQAVAGRERGAGFRGLVPMLGINDTTIPAIEAGYEAFLSDFDAHLEHHDYLFGSRPSIGDYGLIGPLYAHLYRDPASGEIMERLAPRVAQWVRRMVDVEAPQSGEFLAGDAIPETLLPILARMMREQIPHLANVAAILKTWAENSDDAQPPRALGLASFTIEGITSERLAFPFSLWMLQRSLDYFASLSDGDRAACEKLMQSVGGEALVNFDMPVRLKFEDHKLTVAGR
ncbi:MAG: glutathione S-transferase family protein [Erythrobacter sp.]